MRVTGRAIVIFVSVVGAAAFASGWWLTANVREVARRTDGELEGLSRALRAWAQAHDGNYPTSEVAFLSGCTAADRSASQAALRHVQLRWPPTGDLAPVLEANGLPTGLGTLDRLNEGLRASARRHAPSGAAPATP
jgi:hypothetical protein